MSGPARESAAEELLLQRKGQVQWVTFNRPQARNALTWEMYERLAGVCDAVNRDQSIRAVVLTGAGGKAFVAGTDISQFRDFRTEEDALRYEAGGSKLMDAIESVRVPTIAAIAGACTGAGGAIAAACDLRIASPSARYGFPIARTLGNCLSMSNYARVSAIVGVPRLIDLIMRARLMDAQEMLAAGMLSELTTDEAALPRRAQEIAEEVAANAPLTLWATKVAVQRLRNATIPKDADRDLIVRCYLSHDFREGVEAFLAKRKPVWTGD